MVHPSPMFSREFLGVAFGPKDLAFPGDNRGDAVCEISIEDDRCVVRGRTGATAEGRPRQAWKGRGFVEKFILREAELKRNNITSFHDMVGI